MPYTNKTFQQRVHAVVRVLFAVFLFFYFLYSQAPLISLAQHQLSKGQTFYSPFVGAVVLTLLLCGLQRLVCRFIRFRRNYYILTFFPSASIAVLLTAFTPETNYVVVTLLVVMWLIWFALVWHDSIMGGWKQNNDANGVVLPQTIGFLALAMFLGLCGNSNDVLTYEVQTAKALNDGRYAEALKIGDRALATSGKLTAMRTFAMSHYENGLPETLFRYPLPEGGSSMLFLQKDDTLSTLFSPDSLYTFVGCRPASSRMKAFEYFEKSVRRRPNGPARDYWLCALLLDKQLSRFAEELPHYYTVSDSVVLPHYYAEAMILYSRLCQNPVVRYADPNIAANYLDFKEKGEKIPDFKERRNLLWREYGDTYWWYYFYHQ